MAAIQYSIPRETLSHQDHQLQKWLLRTGATNVRPIYSPYDCEPDVVGTKYVVHFQIDPKNLLALLHQTDFVFDVKLHLDWDDVERLASRLARLIQARGVEYDILFGIARGGMHTALMLGQALPHGMTLTCHLKQYQETATDTEDVPPKIIHFPPRELFIGKKVLIADEVLDRGGSLRVATEEVRSCDAALVDTGVYHFKPKRNRTEIVPTYFVEETEEWVVYPWERFGKNHQKLLQYT